MSTWLIYALLSALCAAFVSIFGKVGVAGLDSSAATAVRAVIMAVFLVGVVVMMAQIPGMQLAVPILPVWLLVLRLGYRAKQKKG